MQPRAPGLFIPAQRDRKPLHGKGESFWRGMKTPELIKKRPFLHAVFLRAGTPRFSELCFPTPFTICERKVARGVLRRALTQQGLSRRGSKNSAQSMAFRAESPKQGEASVPDSAWWVPDCVCCELWRRWLHLRFRMPVLDAFWRLWRGSFRPHSRHECPFLGLVWVSLGARWHASRPHLRHKMSVFGPRLGLVLASLGARPGRFHDTKYSFLGIVWGSF